MKFIVPTYTRVGSTWVCEVLQKLQGQEKRYAFIGDRTSPLGTKATGEELQLFRDEDNGVIKSHSYAPVDLLELAQDEDIFIVGVVRDFRDAFVSRVLYERHTRLAQGLDISPWIQEMIEAYPGIPDEALINLLIETKREDVEKELRLWRLFSHTCSAANVLHIAYSDIVHRPLALITRLNQHIRATSDVVTATKEATSFSAMQKKHDDGFVRRGAVGDHTAYLDSLSLQWLNHKINLITKTKTSEI